MDVDDTNAPESQEADAPQGLVDVLDAVLGSAGGVEAPRDREVLAVALRHYRRSRLLHTLIRRAGMLAAAACLVLAALVAVQWQARPAFAGVLTRSAGQMFYLPPVLDDREFVERLHTEIDQLRRERDGLLQTGSVGQALTVWQGVYNRLSDLGEWDAALTEMRAALDYCDAHPIGDRPNVWTLVCLDELGTVYLAKGDIDGSIAAYRESLAARYRYTDFETPILAAQVHRVVVAYWRLNRIALLQGSLDGAAEALTGAEQLLRALFAAVREAAGLPPIATSASVYEAFRSMPTEFQQPVMPVTKEYVQSMAQRYRGFVPGSSLVMITRRHFAQAARLSRLRGDLASASRLLAEARALAYYPAADEYHVLFEEPMEAARIEIARQQYAEALTEIDEAARHIGDIIVTDASGPDKRAVSPEYQSEIPFLRGVALIGLNPSDPEGRRLISRALALPRAWEARISDPAQRAAFRKRFGAWYELAERLGI